MEIKSLLRNIVNTSETFDVPVAAAANLDNTDGGFIIAFNAFGSVVNGYP